MSRPTVGQPDGTTVTGEPGTREGRVGSSVEPPETGLFIDNQFRPASDGGTLATLNPATDERLAEVACGTCVDVDAAVAAASRAFGNGWASAEPSDRAHLLREAAKLLSSHREELATIEARDVGKPITDCRAEVDLAADWFDFFADIGRHMRSDVIPGMRNHLNYTLREPLGVAALVTPWNYPLAIYGFKLPAALATGNTVVLKPAEKTPLSALALAALLREAGFPPGVFNVLNGDGPVTGRSLVRHEGVSAVSFTGSTAVGRRIARDAGKALKKVALELGGKSPYIVFPDADLDAAACTALFTYTVNQGQLCTAGTRLLVHEAVAEQVLELIVRAGRSLRIGDPLNPQTQLGAMIDSAQVERIERYVSLAVDEGAKVVTGGEHVDLGAGFSDCFYTPTVLTGVRPDSRVAREEIFGPVLSVFTFSTEEEAIRLANDTDYGLAASIWTSDGSRALRLARAVQAGLVWVNNMHVLSPGSPYGGVKASGVGVEGGIEQAMGYTRLKTVWINYGDTSVRY